MFQKKYLLSLTLLIFIQLIFLNLPSYCEVDTVFTAKDLLNIQSCDEVLISPDGKWIAFTVKVTRDANDTPGPIYRELYLASNQTKEIKPILTGKVTVSTVRWKPDSTKLTFLMKGNDQEYKQIWAISLPGNEPLQVSHAEADISDFQWHPKQNKLAYIAETPKTLKEKKLQEKGYDFVYYEENLKHLNVYLLDLDAVKAPIQLTDDLTAWDCIFSPNGEKIAFSASPKNLIDQKYMFRKIFVLDLKTLDRVQLTNNSGKLGKYEFSPDNSRIVYTAALERKDHAVSQVYMIDVNSKEVKNLTESDFQGHVDWAVWKNNKTILYFSYEGVYPTLSLIPATGGKREIILHSKNTGVIFSKVSFSTDFKLAAFGGNAPYIPGELYLWKVGQKTLNKLTQLNPWISQKNLGKQEVIRYQSRDGWDIEGLLIYPVDYKDGQRYPLIVTVHGGPESHYSNGWVSRYSEPGQVLSGKGYVVFYPNYRASIGYGVKYALIGYKDPAGKEFDDIVDGIEFLSKKGIADPDRVGIGGGSYGGYAAAWFASYYTKKVRAACVFVGITDLISKRGCGDIPYEELYVHAGDMLEKNWDFSLKRSPVYWAHQSQTAVLILGGKDDPRIHPGQSLEFYRRLKMNNHPAVRLVQYPGEGHGNRKQVGQIDLLYRTIQWYDWYVKEKKPLDDSMPPLDISECYGIDL